IWDTSELIGKTWNGQRINAENFDKIFFDATTCKGLETETFGLPAWYRFSTAGSEEDIKEAIRRTKRFVAEVRSTPEWTERVNRTEKATRWFMPSRHDAIYTIASQDLQDHSEEIKGAFEAGK